MNANFANPDMQSRSAAGMQWLRHELQQGLDRARLALEHYLETPDDRQPMYLALDELRVIRGTFGIIECFGAQMLAAEVELMLRALAEERVANADEAFSTLSGATLLLYDYIDLLAIGVEDCALALQPVINELRLQRGLPLMTEADLFSEQMRGLFPVDARNAADVWTSRAIAARELAEFQAAFLQWFRGRNAPLPLDRMCGISSRLSAVSGSRAVSEFWGAVSALTECLPPNANELLDVKRLLGRASALLKIQAEQGEGAVISQLGDATYHILLHLGRSPRIGTRGQALANRFRLAALLPGPNTLDEIRRRLRGPSTTVLGRVHEEIGRDFAEIKDALDLALRTRRYKATDLAAPRERLRRLANSLSTLGLAPQQQIITNQIRALEQDCQEDSWLDIAVAILRVELSLQETLFRAPEFSSTQRRRYGSEQPLPQLHDLLDSRRALLREALVNMALFKAAIDRYLRDGANDDSEYQPKWLGEIRASLNIIENARAAAAVERLERYIGSRGLRLLSVNASEAERFAEVVSGIELYLESLRDEQPYAERLLAETESRLMYLRIGEPPGLQPAVVEVESAGEPTGEPVEAAAQPGEAPAVAEFAPEIDTVVAETATTVAAESPAEAAPSLPAVVMPPEEEIDPEIREVFIEEAGEVLGELRRQIAKFRSEPGSQALLTEVRRAFHTLKGSGRMVGAKRIAELGWAIESLLNQCLSGALPVRAPIIEAVDRAVAQLPGLIENFIAGTPESADVSALIVRAKEIASGDDAEVDMLAVFKEDARERIDAIRRWLEAQDVGFGASSVPPDLLRAVHTLRGSAAVVNATAINRVSGELEGYLSSLQFASASVPPAALALLADAVIAMKGWIEIAGTDEADRIDVAPWVARIEDLQGHLKVSSRAKDAIETYALSALDELQKFEKALNAWIATPESSAKPATASLQAFVLQAGHAGDKTSANVASAVLDRLSAATAPPAAETVPAFAAVVEGLYGLLDAFREARSVDPAPLLRSIEELPLATAADDFDVELAQIFLSEGEELLQAFGESLKALHENPGNIEECQRARRVVHTLKGSARMAGYWAIGNVAESLEVQLGGDAGRDDLPLVQISAGADELRALIDRANAQLQTAPAPEAATVESQDAAADHFEPAGVEPLSAESLPAEEIGIEPLAPVAEAPAPVEIVEAPPAPVEAISEAFAQTPIAEAPIAEESLLEPFAPPSEDQEALTAAEAPATAADETPPLEDFTANAIAEPVEPELEFEAAPLAEAAPEAEPIPEVEAAPAPEAWAPREVETAPQSWAAREEAVHEVWNSDEAESAQEGWSTPEVESAFDTYQAIETPLIEAYFEPPAVTDSPAMEFVGELQETTSETAPESALVESGQPPGEVLMAEDSAALASVEEVAPPPELPEVEESHFEPAAEAPAPAEAAPAELSSEALPEPAEPAPQEAVLEWNTAPSESFEEPPKAEIGIGEFAEVEAAEVGVSEEQPLSIALDEDQPAEPGMEAPGEVPTETLAEESLGALAEESAQEPASTLAEEPQEVSAEHTGGQPPPEPQADHYEPPQAADSETHYTAPAAYVHEQTYVYEQSGGDHELTEIFAAESTELLEALDGSIEAWQGGDEVEAVREIQRSLHTLKGGARMAGVVAMGDAAHQMESDVNQLLIGGEFPGADAFEMLHKQIHRLRDLHDRFLRGDLLVGPPAPQQPELEEAAPQDAAGVPVAPRRPSGSSVWAADLFWKPETALAGLGRRETARVPVETLEAMLNEAGEISIYRSRMEQQNVALQQQLNEMTQTISRVRDQLRLLDAETEAQIAARGLVGAAPTGQLPDRYGQDFDPLEMDRFSRMQELSRSLAESINDLASVRSAIDDVVSEKDVLLQQQGRINSDVQQGLMGTLMVPFSRQAPRLERVVRQTASENGRSAEVIFSGIEAELDRNVLERMTAPLEHLLRNAVVHGIELPHFREAVGKPASGTIRISLRREGSQLLVEVSDDGAGLDYLGIRNKAIERGLMQADAELSDSEIARFILEPGFSTARELTQDAGRGVGMDVVAAGVKQLGGTLEMASEVGKGTRFQVRLPLTLALSQSLLVNIGAETYAIPLPAVEGIVRVPRNDEWLGDDAPPLRYGDENYRVRYLGDLLQAPRSISPDDRSFMAILLRIGESLGTADRRVALIVDQLIGNREIVSKAVGPQISAVPGITGATILADGRVVLILDVPALVIAHSRVKAAPRVIAPAETRELVMVVDDSVTMRRIAERLLIRHGYRVVTAKDGLDAMAQLQTETPALVLLDIEMPRADGFEVAAFIRNTARLSEMPIVMITSRSGEKHRERARQLGVNRYLIKPYQEDQLISVVQELRGQVTA